MKIRFEIEIWSRGQFLSYKWFSYICFKCLILHLKPLRWRYWKNKLSGECLHRKKKIYVPIKVKPNRSSGYRDLKHLSYLYSRIIFMNMNMALFDLNDYQMIRKKYLSLCKNDRLSILNFFILSLRELSSIVIEFLWKNINLMTASCMTNQQFIFP